MAECAAAAAAAATLVTVVTATDWSQKLFLGGAATIVLAAKSMLTPSPVAPKLATEQGLLNHIKQDGQQ